MPQAKIDLPNTGAVKLLPLKQPEPFVPFGRPTRDLFSGLEGSGLPSPLSFRTELQWKQAVAESLSTVQVDEDEDRASFAGVVELPAESIEPGQAGFVRTAWIEKAASEGKPSPLRVPAAIENPAVEIPDLQANPLRFRMKSGAAPGREAPAKAPAKPAPPVSAKVAPASPAKPAAPAAKAAPVAAPPKAAPKPVEPKPVEVKAEARIEKRPAEAKAPEAKPEPKVEAKVGQKVEPKVEPKLEQKVEPKTEPKTVETAISSAPSFGRSSTLTDEPQAGGLPAVVKVGVPVVAVLAAAGYFLFGSGADKPVTPSAPSASAMMGENNWVTEWASDAAGSRRGRQLQFYRPSQTLANYTFEFSAMMESKAVGWVFRAEDTKNYYGMKIEESSPGSIQLTRFAVVDGRESSVSSKPLPIAANAATVFQVKLEANGPRFTAFVQGQPVEVWVDNRLKSGAVGLMTERDERARMISARFSIAGAGK